MLFRLTNILVACIDLMNRIFHSYFNKFIIVYIDNSALTNHPSLIIIVYIDNSLLL